MLLCPAMELGATSRVRRTDADFVSTEVDGELVFMHIERGIFYGLREAALEAWKHIDEDGAWTPMSDLVAPLLREFEVDAETCLKDLAVLIDDLSEAGLAAVAP